MLLFLGQADVDMVRELIITPCFLFTIESEKKAFRIYTMKEYFKRSLKNFSLFLGSVFKVVYLSFYCYLITREYVLISKNLENADVKYSKKK